MIWEKKFLLYFRAQLVIPMGKSYVNNQILNESRNNWTSQRKLSAKQHYLSVARYIAGQSTKLTRSNQIFQNQSNNKMNCRKDNQTGERTSPWSHLSTARRDKFKDEPPAYEGNFFKKSQTLNFFFSDTYGRKENALRHDSVYVPTVVGGTKPSASTQRRTDWRAKYTNHFLKSVYHFLNFQISARIIKKKKKFAKIGETDRVMTRIFKRVFL